MGRPAVSRLLDAWEAHSLSVLSEGRFEMSIGTGRPGIEDQLRELGLPVVPRGERLAQVRHTLAALRQLDGVDVHTPVVMADDPGAEIAQLALDFRALLAESTTSMSVVMYVKPGCPYCAAAREDLAAKGEEVEERDATRDPAWKAELMGYTANTGVVPTIVREDGVQVGFPPGRG